MDAAPSHDEEQHTIALRQKLIDYLKQQGHIRTPAVETAMREVPRHPFLPAENVEQVYSDIPIKTKVQDGEAISSSSQPTIMAIMLEQLDLQPGQRVLEIGAGTGYNAALMAHIVGTTGSVVTMDIDEDIVSGARVHLQRAGYERVRVVLADGAFGCPDDAPYDRIILTTSAADIAPAWREQLKPGGRLVLPFKLTQIAPFSLNTASWLISDQVLLTLQHPGADKAYIESVDIRMCGFMPLRGTFALSRRPLVALDSIDHFYMNALRPVERSALVELLQNSFEEVPLPVNVILTGLFALRLWLALRDPYYCEVHVRFSDTEKVPPTSLANITPLDPAIAALGLYADNTLCFLSRIDSGNQQGHMQPFGLTLRTIGTSRELTGHLIREVITWDAAGQPFQWGPQGTMEHMRIRVYPRDALYTPVGSEFVVDRPGSRFVFSY